MTERQKKIKAGLIVRWALSAAELAERGFHFAAAAARELTRYRRSIG